MALVRHITSRGTAEEHPEKVALLGRYELPSACQQAGFRRCLSSKSGNTITNWLQEAPPKLTQSSPAPL